MTSLPEHRDDMHLGPAAMQMIGEGIAKDIAENRGDAWFAHEDQGAEIKSTEKTETTDKPQQRK